MRLIKDIAERDGLTDLSISLICRTSRPRASNLLHDHIGKFNSETLIDILWRLGVTVEVVVTQRTRYLRYRAANPRRGWRPTPGMRMD